MAKFCELLQSSEHDGLVSLRQDLEWADLIARDKQQQKRHEMYERKRAQSRAFSETASSIFRECQGQRMRKRAQSRHTLSTGSIVMAVRVGKHTTCVCKCKM